MAGKQTENSRRWLTCFRINSSLVGVPLLFWTILFIKRRHGVADTLLLLEDPANVQRKERVLTELRHDLIDRGKKIDEDQLQFFESEMMAEFLRDKKLKVSDPCALILAMHDTHFFPFA